MGGGGEGGVFLGGVRKSMPETVPKCVYQKVGRVTWHFQKHISKNKTDGCHYISLLGIFNK